MKFKFIIFLLLLTSNVYPQEYSPTYFSTAELQKDLRFLKKKVTSIHPKFEETSFYNKWVNQYNSVYLNIPDSISFNKFYSKAAPLMSMLKDGHSNFSFPYSERIKYMKNGGVTMPLTVKIKNDNIYIEKYFGETHEQNIDGLEILSVNGKPATDILKELQKFSGAKKASIINHNIEKYFGAYFWTVYGKFPQYNIEVLKDGKKKLLSFNPVTNSEYFKLRNKRYPKQKEEKYCLSFFEKNDFAYLKIKSFANIKTLSEFLEHTFDTIIENESKNLIIDLRNNFGGSSDGVDTLLSYLTNEQYRQYSSIGLRINNDVRRKYKNKQSGFYENIKNLENNTIFYYNDDLLNKRPGKRKNLFKGNVFVLVNDKTFSAASTFTGVVKEFALGEIIGQSETGGTIEYFGDFLNFKLPNTRINFFISSKIFRQYGGEEINNGVSPDIVINENREMEIPTIIEQIRNADHAYEN